MKMHLQHLEHVWKYTHTHEAAMAQKQFAMATTNQSAINS